MNIGLFVVAELKLEEQLRLKGQFGFFTLEKIRNTI